MVFPVRSDRRIKRQPWVNYALIGINIALFLLTYRQVQVFGPALVRGYSLDQIREALPVIRFYLWPDQPQLYQYLSYQFLHHDWMHIGFNMLFLWVFGNEVEERLGHLGYLFFYLAGGVVAGLAHALPGDSAPILGASGSVAAVTGAYLALFPLAELDLIVPFLGVYTAPSIVFIGFRIVYDIVSQLLGIGNVAYVAHLAGYGYGFAVALALLLARILPREQYDILALATHRWRRWTFQRMARRGAYPWDLAKPSDPTRGPAPELDAAQAGAMAQRARISQALAQQRHAEAARLYADLLRADPRQVMSGPQQLDLATQLASDGRAADAARAYELLLAHYPQTADRPRVQLVLALLYVRELGERTRAQELLKEAIPGLRDGDQDLARQLLGEVSA